MSTYLRVQTEIKASRDEKASWYAVMLLRFPSFTFYEVV